MTTEKLLRVIHMAVEAYCRVETGRFPYIVKSDDQILIYPTGMPMSGNEFFRIEVEHGSESTTR